MKVFLVWSGRRSFAIAQALHEFLPRVIQAVKPFFSHEIEKGAKWSGEIDSALEGTRFGIVCLTPENLDSTWIHYEAGALSKTKDALIWTYLTDLKNSEVPQPIGKFQHTLGNKSDTLKLIKTINSRLSDVGGEPLSDQILLDNFEVWWPKFNDSISAATPIAKSNSTSDQPRDHGAMLEEILELLRDQKRLQTKRNNQQLRIPKTFIERRYHKLDIEIPGDILNSNKIVETFSNFFSEYLQARAIRSDLGEKQLLRFSWAEPLSVDDVRDLLGMAAEVAGWTPLTWKVME